MYNKILLQSNLNMLILDEKTILENSLKCENKMNFKDFVKFNSIDLDAIFVNKMFHNLDNNIPIYMDQTMIEYFGYSGKLCTQTSSVKNLIDTNFLEYQDKLWWTYSDKKYIEYRESLDDDFKKNYPSPQIGRGKSNTRHTLIMPKLFKLMLLMTQSIKGKRIKNYYIDLEDAFLLYFKYQCLFDKLEFKKEYPKIFNKKYTRQQAILELDENIQQRYRIGCVYYIQEELTKNIKIGWCWNLLNRLNNLQTANSQKLSVLKYEICQFPYKREQELHKKYKDYHIRGEWFKNII
jgi:hypothetical protein